MENKCEKDFTLQNELIAKIQLVVTTLDDIDKIIDDLNIKQSENDKLISDYLHLCEDYDLSDTAMINVAKRLHDCRIVRRNFKNMASITHTYTQNIQKLIYKEQRGFFRNSMKCTINNLNNEYKNRVLTEEEQKLILELEEPTKEKNTPSKSVDKKNNKVTSEQIVNIAKLLKKGKTVKEISKELNLSLNSVYYIRNKYTNSIK